MKHFAIVILLSTLLAGTAFAVPNVVPAPKSLEVSGGAIQLISGSTAIAIGENASEPEKYAAETLQRSVAKRFGQTWPVMSENDDLRPYRVLIVLGLRSTATTLNRLCREWKVDLSDETPGHDGYIIRMGRDKDRDVVLVGGSNARSVIYGQDTLLQLIHRQGSSLLLDRASIRDWPSIPWRGKPQTSYMRHLEPGEADWYAHARLNFTDLRNGTYAFEPGAQLDGPQIRKSVDECHRRGMIVYAAVDCGIPTSEHDAALATFSALIDLGADGLWISFDDKGPGEAPEELVGKVLDLGRKHNITGCLIAVTPPKGSYQVISADFNRRIAAVPGMSEAIWFFTSIPSARGMKDAESLGLKTKPAWWHNWPRVPGHGMVGVSAHSMGFYGGSGYERISGPAYMPIPTLAEGWHQPSYEALSGSGEWTSAVMQWGGSGWKYEWTYPVLGWWAWSPSTHDWDAVRRRTYDMVYGPDLVEAGTAFDNALYELRKLFVFSLGSNEADPVCPPQLLSIGLRPRARGLIADMEKALAKLQGANPDGSFTTPTRLSKPFLAAEAAEVAAAKACTELIFPESWWDSHQRKVLDAVYDGDLPRADRLIDSSKNRVLSQIDHVRQALPDMQGLDKRYVTPWTERARLDARAWQKIVRDRSAQFDKCIGDLEYLKFGDPDKVLFKGLAAVPRSLPVISTVMPGGREMWSGAHLSGIYRKGERSVYAFAYPLKVLSHRGEYDEVDLTIKTSGSAGWHGVRFFINSWTNDIIAYEHMPGRYLGRRFIQVLLDDDVLWESDVALPRGEGEWVTVGLPPCSEKQTEYRLRLRVEDREESDNYGSAVFVSPFQVLYAAR